MSDVNELISKIVMSIKSRNPDSSDAKVYHDEPIIKTARQLSNFVPPEIKKMKQLATGYDYYQHSLEYLFYKQGKLMEDYEDDYEFHGEFNRYFPDYQFMNNDQLRGYFSWRTKVRHGTVEKTCTSFAFLYIYELINMIGVKTPEEGFDTLVKFAGQYRQFDEHIDFYMRIWLCDYVVYYNLDRSLLNEYTDTDFDSALMVLLSYRSKSDEELFDAISHLSSYNIIGSKFFKQYPEVVKSIVCSVFKSISEYSDKNRKRSYCEKLFGNGTYSSYYMFSSAVFYDHIKYQDYKYVINDIHSYRCKNGNWVCEKYYRNRGRSKELGSVLKAVDCMLRQKYEFRYPLKQEKTTKLLTGMIEKAADEYIALQKKNAAPVIEIDLSKLQGIRNSSEIIRDKLIVDEEEIVYSKDILSQQENDLPKVTQKEPEPGLNNEQPEIPCTDKQDEADQILNETEYRLMQYLLYGGDYSSFIRQKGEMLSVVIDSINEKLFDMFSDTVIMFDGDTPEIIEDYTEELKGIVAK
ncbi:MAG: TerB N-terminal domain-containing protein [Oscillospiraceae bacterium]|nr:TerB N-terminal domain-containing protein [Oscillospiraceae bacterium]